MKKQFLSFVVALAAFGSIANAQPTIYAYRNWQQISGEAVKGPVKFPADNPRDVTLIADQSKLGCVYAGAYYNYKWYAQVTNVGTQSSVDGLYTIDYTTGERTLIVKGGTQLADMTYDYATNTMYGIKYGAHTLAKIDLNTGVVTTVGDFANSTGTKFDILALACDAQGNMYGVGPDDTFYSIDKTTAVGTSVGLLGVDAAFTQSMTFDLATGKLYWANNGDYTLYEIDVTTGVATRINDVGVDGVDSTNSLFIPWINVPEGAPDRVTGRAASTQGSDVTLSWVNPSVDAQGNAMADYSGVKIYRDETLVATIDCTIADAGQAASYQDKGLENGSHSYKIVPFNSKGDGGVDTDALSTYVGKNAPGAVGNLVVTQGDSQAILSWTAPVEGMYGGEYDVNSVTKYVITRSQGTSVVKSECTETTYTDTPAFGTYTYSVHAVNDVGEGVVTTAAPIMVKPADWIVMMTGVAEVETGKTYKFYDTGGPSGSYSNSSNDTLVIKPKSANGVVKVEFETLDIESYDNLAVYNGSSVNAPKVGDFAAFEVPVELKSLVSTSSDGALTFVFESDIMDRYSGWVANVSASEKLEFDLALNSFKGDLYAENGVASKYVASVQNKGVATIAAADYKVVVKDSLGTVLAEIPGADVESMAVAALEVELTLNAEGVATLYAEIQCAKDGDSTNNNANFTVTVLAAGSQFVEINPGTEEIYVSPASFMSDESVSQTIYYASEIGVESGLLKMISFPYYEVSKTYPDIPVKVWVAETDKTDLSSGNLRSSEMTLVFEGNCPVTAGDKEWAIQLDEGYSYSGGNLVVMVYKDAPGTEYEGVTFVGTYDDAAERTRFDSAWDSTENVNHDEIFGWSASTIVPNVKMLFTSDTGVETLAEIKNRVKVYPNPVVSVLNIEAEVVTARLFSLSGQEVVSVANSSEINVADVPAGIYVLNVVTADGEVLNEKVIKK